LSGRGSRRQILGGRRLARRDFVGVQPAFGKAFSLALEQRL
jgi:hypothetical protein